MHSIKYFFIYYLLYFDCFNCNDNDFNPYEILGVSRTASDQDIRKAYKKLAKYWHPDKNSQPNAHEQFTKINNAYDILSDSTKRQNYDEYGTTSQENQRGFNTNHFRDPFDIFRMHFFHEGPSDAKKVIHSYEFLKNIFPNSDKKPYLIFGTTNLCFHCRRALTIFRSMEIQLNDVGIGTGEFNIHDERLSNELGISNIPSLCIVVRHRVYHFNEQDFTEGNIKEFIRKSIPIKRFIRKLENFDEIIRLISSANQTNRVHALLITKQKYPTLKFVIPCLQYSLRIQCAIINSSVIQTDNLPNFFKSISFLSDTILLFKEDIDQPNIVIKDNDFNRNSIEKIFQTNQLLHLPIITSSNVFDLVCQTNSMKPCFLIIGNTELFVQYHSLFLHLSKRLYQISNSHIAYLDISSHKQAAFNAILSTYYQHQQMKLLILAVRRWYDGNIEIQNTNIELNDKILHQYEYNRNDLIEKLNSFINNRWQYSKKSPLPMIFDLDEKYENIFIKIIDRLEEKWNYYIERNRFLRYFVSYLYTYTFWIITMFLIVYICYLRQEPEESDIHSKKTEKISLSRKKIYKFDQSVLTRYTQAGAPNVIILLLIADSSKDPCVNNFKRDINSINDSHFIFSILFREQSSKWLDELSKQIPENISIDLSSSTILALYIRRKYFVVYSPENKNKNNNHQEQIDEFDSLNLTFFDWIDLLLNGNFREQITLTDWPKNFQ